METISIDIVALLYLDPHRETLRRVRYLGTACHASPHQNVPMHRSPRLGREKEFEFKARPLLVSCGSEEKNPASAQVSAHCSLEPIATYRSAIDISVADGRSILKSGLFSPIIHERSLTSLTGAYASGFTSPTTNASKASAANGHLRPAGHAQP